MLTPSRLGVPVGVRVRITPPRNKGKSDIPTAPHVFLLLLESRVNLPSLEVLQHTYLGE